MQTDVAASQLQRDIATAENRLAQLKQAAAKLAAPDTENDPKQDWLEGGQAIADFLDWPLKRVYAVYGRGKFCGAVWKTGWRSMYGSRSKLRGLPDLIAKN